MASPAKLRFVMVLTFARFPLVLLFFVGAIIHTEDRPAWIFLVSFAFLVLSAVTDLLDGYFARKFDVVTEFGSHADPLMDKFFYLASFPLLVFVSMRNGHVTHAIVLLVMTLLFLSRDQWVTFLRSIGAIYSASGKARWIGKLRTAVNFPLICAVYYYECSPWQLINGKLLYAVEAGALVINMISIYSYTRSYWPYLRRSASATNEGDSRP